MPVQLRKGQRVSLSGLRDHLVVGLGWDPNRYAGGYDFDLDASAFILGENGKVRSDEDLVFYNNPDRSDAGVRSGGDDRTGGNSDGGDDEQIFIELSKVPADVSKIAITVTIHDALVRRQNFGQVSNAYVRVAALDESGAEAESLLRYDLEEDFSIETALVVCEFYRRNGQWKFNAVGAGFSGGLEALCHNYGVEVD